jgi:hypothetical protein
VDEKHEHTYRTPGAEDQLAFLLRLFFGKIDDPLRACVNLAYFDMCRTLRGISTLPRAVELRESSHLHVRTAFENLKAQKDNLDQDAFDGWHRDICHSLCSHYESHGFSAFAIGQSQKWINMTLKYIYVFGEDRLPGYGHLYSLGHVPVDNVMQEKFGRCGANPLTTPWSRLGNYDEYLEYQYWIREHFAGSAPLAVEFHLW